MADDVLTMQQVTDEGLVGTLVLPPNVGPMRRRPAVVTLGGSEGGLRVGAARAFAQEGFVALALAYFGIEPLPAELVEVPLEYVGAALDWLVARPEVAGDKVAVVGASKGGELALLAGATFPDRVGAVAAYVPSGVVWQGITRDRRAMRAGPRSSWTYEGAPLPFVPFARLTPWELLQYTVRYLRRRPIRVHAFYARGLDDRDAVAAATIPVERIDGPVVVVSGDDDGVWPSTLLATLVVERLRAHGHPHRVEHRRYRHAGHMITVPGAELDADNPDVARFGLGGTPAADAEASRDAWPIVVDVLREALSVHG